MKTISYDFLTILCYISELFHYCIPGTENNGNNFGLTKNLVTEVLFTWETGQRRLSSEEWREERNPPTQS